MQKSKLKLLQKIGNWLCPAQELPNLQHRFHICVWVFSENYSYFHFMLVINSAIWAEYSNLLHIYYNHDDLFWQNYGPNIFV